MTSFFPPAKGDPNSPHSTQHPGRRPPPDYRSRTVQLRLFMLVGSLLLVVMIVARVRDPAFWQMLGFEDRPIAGGPPLTPSEIAEHDVNTQLRPPPTDSADLGLIDTRPRSAANGSRAEPTVVDPEEPAERWGVAGLDHAPELVAATRDAWHFVLGEVDGDQQSLLFLALDRLREGQRLDTRHADAWRKLIDDLGTAWNSYVQRATDALTALPEEDQQAWQGRLATLRQRWPEHWRTLLETWIGAEPAPPIDPVLLERLSAHLDHAAAATIRDNTMSRAVEKGIWFRWFGQLRDTDPDEIRRRSLGPTGYLPLFKQSAEYRGKLVTVRGTAHQAYRVSAPDNLLGIEHYYVFWIRPAGGPNSPIVVYSLELPAGFPPVKDKLRDGEATTLHEEMEVTGYFFKRWAYQAAEDILVAPLILARVPRWQPAPVAESTEPDVLSITTIVIVAGAIGIGLAIFALRNAPGTRQELRDAVAARLSGQRSRSGDSLLPDKPPGDPTSGDPT